MDPSYSGDAIVIGGGLIGLAIAFELAECGATVRVFDRGQPGHGASWAGAGMLAPYTEGIEDEAMLQLCIASLKRYPAFVQRIVHASQIAVELPMDGIMEAAFSEKRLEELRGHAERSIAKGARAHMLDRREALLAEPSLGHHVIGALLMSGQGYVDNRRLGRALLEACRRLGVVLHAPAQALAVECDARRVRGVRTDRGFASAHVVINAAGAWSSLIEGIPQRALPPVTPVKGQMLALAAPAGFLRRTTWVPEAYLVPRVDGRLLVGATVEDAGYDERVTARPYADRRPACGHRPLPERYFARAGNGISHCEFCRNGRCEAARRICAT
jgi:glycine oxidase